MILAKDETKSSVLHFFKNETFKDADPHNDKATYTPDVAFKNVKDFTFNVIESHLPRVGINQMIFFYSTTSHYILFKQFHNK